MPRYIDADALCRDTEKRISEAHQARMAVVDDEFLDLINDAYVDEDVVEVVRCKDCDFGRKTAESDELVRCRITGYRRELEHFCAYGVKGGESHD